MTNAAPAATVTPEGAVLPPPPEPVPESVTIEPVPFGRQLWDLVTLLGPLTPIELRLQARFPLGETWREYIRWNNLSHNTKANQELLRKADQEYFDRALQQAIERGWLVLERGKVKADVCPPEHTPGKTIGNERALRSKANGNDERMAYELLINKKSAARHLDISRRAELRKSLKAVGQMYPILRWQPFGNEPIIIDGVTRQELLLDIGVPDDEIRYEDLGAMTAVEALQRRIELELNSTSKDLRDEARNKYIADLAAVGFTQQQIAKLVAVSQQRVSKILSPLQPELYRRQPTSKVVAEFEALSAGGWNLRAIAEKTGWSKDTVQRYLTGTRTPQPAPLDPARPKQARRVARPSRQDTPEIQEAAQKHGVAPITIGKTAAKKVIATIDGKDEVLQAIMADNGLATKILRLALSMPDRRDFLIEELVKAGLITKV